MAPNEKNPNIVDNQGNNVLHLLCKWKSLDVMLIKTSFIFGVDPKAKNTAGKTPLDVLKSTTRKNASNEPEAIAALQQAIDIQEAFTLRARADAVIGDQFNLLSLDGGGIRGVITARTLQMIERMVGRDVNDCFHWYAGTSTGGIIATMLGILKRKPEYCWKLYLERKRLMFAGGAVKRVFEIIFGESTDLTVHLEKLIRDEVHEAMAERGEKKDFYTLQDIASHNGFPKLTIVTLDVTKTPARPTYFRNYNHVVLTDNFIVEDARLGIEPGNWPQIALTHILRATSAAPTYFQPVRQEGCRFVDGGLTANNPIGVLVQECDALTMHPEESFGGIRDHVTLALSLGTGGKTIIDRPDRTGLFETAQLFTLFQEQSTGEDGKDNERARARFACDSVPFVRLSPTNIDIGLASVSNRDVMTMLWKTDEYILKNKATLQWIADLLCGNVKSKRERSAAARTATPIAQLEQVIHDKTAENDRLKQELESLKLELQRRAAAMLQHAANDTANEHNEHNVNISSEAATANLLPGGTKKKRSSRRTRCILQ